jgi:hypothetical protein
MAKLEDQIEAEVEDEIEEDDRPIKTIVADAAKAYAKAKGRAMFFAAVKSVKARGKSGGKPVKKVRIPSKSASALRIGDITVHGQVITVGRSPLKRNEYTVAFNGDNGVTEMSVSSNEKFKVVERREVK